MLWFNPSGQLSPHSHSLSAPMKWGKGIGRGKVRHSWVDIKTVLRLQHSTYLQRQAWRRSPQELQRLSCSYSHSCQDTTTLRAAGNACVETMRRKCGTGASVKPLFLGSSSLYLPLREEPNAGSCIYCTVVVKLGSPTPKDPKKCSSASQVAALNRPDYLSGKFLYLPK